MNEVLKLIDQGSLRPITPINVFPVSETQQAFRLMQSGRHRGKIVIRPSPGDMVKVMPARHVILIDRVLGNPSQANYSAGGTFQDAFAKHLTRKGIPAVCIDLGSIKSVGYVAQNEGVEERLKKMGYEPIEEEKLLRIIESAIRNPYRPGEACVIITGLALPDEDRKAFWDVERRFGPLTKLSASDGESGDSRGRTKAVDDFKTLLPKTGSAEEATDIVLKVS